VIIGAAFLLVGCNNDNDDDTNLTNGETGQIINTNLRLFRQLVDRDEIVVIYLGSDTCPHCVRFYPTIEAIVEDFEINIYYTNLNNWTASDRRELSEIVGSLGTPTLVILNGNEEIARLSGNRPREMVLEFLEYYGVIEGAS